MIRLEDRAAEGGKATPLFRTKQALTTAARSPRLRLAIAFLPTLLIPIGLGAVIREDLGTPVAVSHVRPAILVETGGALEQFLIDVQNEALFNRVESEGTPGDGK